MPDASSKACHSKPLAAVCQYVLSALALQTSHGELLQVRHNQCMSILQCVLVSM
jgi:hypothetical protein